jgi:hypothetical protein
VKPLNPKSDVSSVEGRYMTLMILWFAFLSTVGLNFFLTLMVPRNNVGPHSALLSFILAGVGTFIAGLSLAVKQKLLERAAEEQRLNLAVQAYIVALALCEVASVLGLLAYFLTNERYYYVLFIIAALFMFVHFPRRAHLLNAAFKGQAQS